MQAKGTKTMAKKAGTTTKAGHTDTKRTNGRTKSSASAAKTGRASTGKLAQGAVPPGSVKSKSAADTAEPAAQVAVTTTRRARKPGSATTVTYTPGPTDDEIRCRAYEIYVQRGCAPGDPKADWLQAERELREYHQAFTAS